MANFILGAGLPLIISLIGYKKQGTAWLTFVLVGDLLAMMVGLTLLVCTLRCSPVICICFLLVMGTRVFFCFKMRKINKKIQTYEFTSTDYFQDQATTLQSAQSKEELTSKYHDTLAHFPPRYKSTLQLVYKHTQKKFALSK